MNLNEVLHFISSADQKTLEQVDSAVGVAKKKYGYGDSQAKPNGWEEEVINIGSDYSPKILNRGSIELLKSTGTEIFIKINK